MRVPTGPTIRPMRPSSRRRPEHRVLVLGARGFIGSAIASAMTGSTVIGQSRRPGRSDLTIDLATASPDEVARALDEIRPSVVVNAAGALWPAPDGTVDIAANEAIVTTLLAAVDRPGVPPPALVHLGSVYEYGPHTGTVTESTPARPNSEYARSKLAASEVALRWPGPATILRPSTVIGPGAPASSLLGGIGRSLAAIADAPDPQLELPPLAGSRDFVDVRDVAAAVRAAVARPGNGVITIASGRAIPVADVVDALVRCSEVAPTVVTRAAPGSPARSAGMDAQRYDVSRAREVLGWRARCSVEESVRRLWRGLSEPPPDVDRT